MNYFLISGIIFVIGFISFLFLFLRNKWKVKVKHIEEYKEGRDKLTFRKKEEVKEEKKESFIDGFY
jgi:CTP:phosphocholine cytidylyltransferase-like protein